MSKKLELIKSAWIDLIGKKAYNDISKYMLENGWCAYGSASDILFCEYRINIHRSSLIEMVFDTDLDRIKLFRPKKILSILKNNGWTSVNDKSDMPKEDCLVKICMEGKVSSIVHKWNFKDGVLEPTQLEIRGYRTHSYKFWLNTVSHYKIHIPEPEPIY